MGDAEQESADKNDAESNKPENLFTLKKWNAVAMWSWDVECDTCAICRVQVMGKLLFTTHITYTSRVLDFAVFQVNFGLESDVDRFFKGLGEFLGCLVSAENLSTWFFVHLVWIVDCCFSQRVVQIYHFYSSVTQ